MRIINVSELNSAICRALHLNPENVQQIDIQICGGKAPSVTVTLTPEAEALMAIAKMVRA